MSAFKGMNVPLSIALAITHTFFFFVCTGSSLLGLSCCMQLSCGECGLLFVAVHRLLIAVASLVTEHGL